VKTGTAESEISDYPESPEHYRKPQTPPRGTIQPVPEDKRNGGQKSQCRSHWIVAERRGEPQVQYVMHRPKASAARAEQPGDGMKGAEYRKVPFPGIVSVQENRRCSQNQYTGG